MCARFTLRTPHSQLLRQFQCQLAASAGSSMVPRFNIAPTQQVAVVRPHSSGRQFTWMTWGLIPSWAKTPQPTGSTINARCETLSEKPAFREAYRKRRCLVLADGYYEWRKEGRNRLPVHFELASQLPMGLAGIWERWQGTTPDGLPLVVESCTVITTQANGLAAPIHDRMPAILHPEEYARWLGEEPASPEELSMLLRPFPDDALTVRPVSQFVNPVQNEGAACLNAPEPMSEGMPSGPRQGRLF